MFLPKDSLRARILTGKMLGLLYFAHRALSCKRGPTELACGGTHAFGAAKYGDSAADSCVLAARP
jgi:hypothetical protein